MSSPELPLPPENLLGMFGGAKGFTWSGPKWVRYFIESCELEPHEHVLDVGCSVGRMAIPLAGYLTPQGRYEGLDIYPDVISWCRENIASRRPNFHFQLADIYRPSGPHGRMRAKDYTFPYGDEEFDFAFLISVFTHMLPDDVEHYLSEITRVLKKGGRCLISFLLLNEESLRLIQAGKSPYELNHDLGTYRLQSTDNPMQLVAYREDFVLGLCRKAGLQIRKPVHYGSWAGRETSEDEAFLRQDCVLAHRPGE